MVEGYSPVWQTWDMVYTSVQPVLDTSITTGGSDPMVVSDSSVKMASPDFRQEVQRKRISLRLSIPALAQKLKCDTTTLAAFERGDDILSDDVHRRLLQELNL